MLKKHCLLFAGLALFTSGVPSAVAADDEMKFNVKGENPGGKGGYLGEVTVSKLSKATATVKWVTGPKKDVVNGIAIRTGSAIGTAYGGSDLYALAVYELQGKTIKAVWTTAAKPAEFGNYELKGSNFDGKCVFTGGIPGSVTFTPGEGGMYKVEWDLTSGRYEGVGVRKGDILVAASGVPGGNFGVAAYQPEGDDIAGVWGTMHTPTAGKEVWTLGGETASAKSGETVTFGGETYELRENKSAPGQATSELREYLRKGEDWEGYRKMVALRMQNIKGADASTLAKNVLDLVKKEHKDPYIKEIKMEAGSSTVMFILLKDNDVEFNLWQYEKTPSGIASAQFVMRNKPPYETQKKFKTEQDSNFNTWLAELETLGEEAEALIKATAGKGTVDAGAGAPTTEPNDAELAKAIKVDLDKCTEIAKKFVSLIHEGNTADAAALMSDTAFDSSDEKAAFATQLAKSSKVFGELKDFKADKDATDFGVKKGVMTFTLFGDAEYANAQVRETYVFIRNAERGVDFVGFNRKVKE